MQQVRIIGLPSQPYVSDAGQWVHLAWMVEQRGPFDSFHIGSGHGLVSLSHSDHSTTHGSMNGSSL